MFSFPFPSKTKKNPRMTPRRPRLERNNASKNIRYSAAATATATASSSLPCSSDSSAASSAIRVNRSLDLSPSYSNQTRFRIGGSIEGEIDLIYKSLGLSGPEDFAVPVAAWEACRARLSEDSDQDSAAGRAAVRVCEDEPPTPRKLGIGDGGIKGIRPPSLTPPETTTIASFTSRSAPPTVTEARALTPPSCISLPEMEKVGSTWDLMKSFAPKEEMRHFESEEEEEGSVRSGMDEDYEDMTSTSNDNDDNSSSSTTTTEGMFVISPNGRFKRNIKAWMKGHSLGSGSFGAVYEGISDDGFFFAVKEVSLLDHGSDAQQCILQLEQEIALLSQFEHENIVQYYGTDKEEAKLFIFLELVPQGSLASLYQKYRLQNSQVSAYTRQILKGLKYLHERDIVHRDIKCANILVHANGSVKLADFGLAKQITEITKLKSCKGSVYWMAPEVANPKSAYGPAADIWSLGCTVLEMLTRQVPYPNMEWQHVFFRVGRGEKPPIPNCISRDARDFITQCVQVNPVDRPSASQLLGHPFVRRPLPCIGLGSDYSSSPGNDRWN